MPRSSPVSRLLAFAALALLACEQGAPAPDRRATEAPVAPTPAAMQPRAARGDPAPTPPPRDAAPSQASPQYAEAAGLMYLEQILGSAQPEDALPMIVAIHGLGDRPEGFAHLLRGFAEPVRLILPRGIDEYEGGWSWFPQRARSRDVEALGGGIAHAAAVLARGITELAQQRPTKGKPIVVGFSQGGMLTFALAVGHPNAVGYAIPVSGWLPPPLWPRDDTKAASAPPIVALHGTADSAVLYEPAKSAVENLDALGYDIQLRTYEGVPHAITAIVQRDLTDLLQDAVQRAARAPAPTPAPSTP